MNSTITYSKKELEEKLDLKMDKLGFTISDFEKYKEYFYQVLNRIENKNKFNMDETFKNDWWNSVAMIMFLHQKEHLSMSEEMSCQDREKFSLLCFKNAMIQVLD